jgi:hypothetical protein
MQKEEGQQRQLGFRKSIVYIAWPYTIPFLQEQVQAAKAVGKTPEVEGSSGGLPNKLPPCCLSACNDSSINAQTRLVLQHPFCLIFLHEA